MPEKIKLDRLPPLVDQARENAYLNREQLTKKEIIQQSIRDSKARKLASNNPLVKSGFIPSVTVSGDAYLRGARADQGKAIYEPRDPFLMLPNTNIVDGVAIGSAWYFNARSGDGSKTFSVDTPPDASTLARSKGYSESRSRSGWLLFLIGVRKDRIINTSTGEISWSYATVPLRRYEEGALFPVEEYLIELTDENWKMGKQLTLSTYQTVRSYYSYTAYGPDQQTNRAVALAFPVDGDSFIYIYSKKSQSFRSIFTGSSLYDDGNVAYEEYPPETFQIAPNVQMTQWFVRTTFVNTENWEINETPTITPETRETTTEAYLVGPRNVKKISVPSAIQAHIDQNMAPWHIIDDRNEDPYFNPSFHLPGGMVPAPSLPSEYDHTYILGELLSTYRAEPSYLWQVAQWMGINVELPKLPEYYLYNEIVSVVGSRYELRWRKANGGIPYGPFLPGNNFHHFVDRSNEAANNYMYVSWDWNQPGWCRDVLKLMGFSDSDLNF